MHEKERDHRVVLVLLKRILLSVLLTVITASTHAATLYDVSFSAPTDTSGQPAALGGSGPVFHSPTGVNFGTSQVVASGGGLNDQPLLLLPQGPQNAFVYSQYAFSISQFDKSPGLEFEMDLSLILDPAPNLGNRDLFTVLFDSPTVSTIQFVGDGTILENNRIIGSFTQGQPIHLGVVIDLPTNVWTIRKDGHPLFSGDFFVRTPLPTEIKTIRVNLADGRSPGTPTAYIDNIRISSVPEPGTALFGIALSGAMLSRRRKG